MLTATEQSRSELEANSEERIRREFGERRDHDHQLKKQPDRTELSALEHTARHTQLGGTKSWKNSPADWFYLPIPEKKGTCRNLSTAGGKELATRNKTIFCNNSHREEAWR